MRDIFTCIVNNVETDYNVTCLPETVETVSGIYGPTLQSTFETSHSLKQCNLQLVPVLMSIIWNFSGPFDMQNTTLNV